MMEKYKEYFVPVAILVAGSMVSLAVLVAGGSTIPQQGLSAEVAGTIEGINEPSDAVLAVTDQDYIRGNPNAPITIVEYSDFECPFCSRFHPTIQQILAEYGDQVRWVYRHFPLDQIHPEATPSAEASECIAEQKGADGFWQFADAMFENQSRLGNSLYREVASQIGADMAQFDNCVTTRKYQDKVKADQAGGAKLGVNGTPGSFVNGTPIRGALPYENVKAIIEAELQKI